MAAKGLTGRAKGGAATAKAMTPTELKARAQKGALARWGKHVIATHKGNFKDQLGLDVECYVLNDINKTPVISQAGLARALGMAPISSVFPRFISSNTMADFVSIELREKLRKPIIFQWGSGGIGVPPASVNGFDAALLIDVCNSIAAAHSAGRLGRRYDKIIQHAAVITGASAKLGIRNLVYAMAGYSPTTAEIIQAFQAYVQEEARKYEREFPPELYLAWHRLYDIPVFERGRSWRFKYLTIKQIYYPLAQSNGKIYELLRALKAKGGNQKTKLFQFLNEVGARALSRHIGRIMEMADDSPSLSDFEAKLLKRFGGQQELDLVVPLEPPTQTE